jgi:hypothetical protein
LAAEQGVPRRNHRHPDAEKIQLFDNTDFDLNMTIMMVGATRF